MLKTILKKQTQKQKTDRQNPKTNGKTRVIQTKSHTEAYTYTLIKREKGENIYIYIYISSLPKSTSSIWDDSCLFRYSTDAGYIMLIVEI